MYDVALPRFYRDIKVTQVLAAAGPDLRLLRSIDLEPSLAPLIRTLDFTELQGVGAPWVIPRSLTVLPRLRSLHLQLLDLKQLNDQDIQRIFFGMPDLETLVIKTSCSKTYPACLAEILRTLEPVNTNTFSNIRSLTCRARSEYIQSWTAADHVDFVDVDVFSNFLPRFPKLQVLDLAYTSVNPRSLLKMNPDARLQLLRITNCENNDTSMLAQFLATHPAVSSSLVVLDVTYIGFSPQDTSMVLAGLPLTLRSLNLSSSTMAANHVPQLQKLCRHLEELSVGYGLTMDHVEAIMIAPNFDFAIPVPRRSVQEARTSKLALRHEVVLGPLRDAIAVCNLRRRLISVSPLNGAIETSRSPIKFLGLGSMDEEEQGRITSSVLLGEHSKPLKLIAVPNISNEDYHILQKLCGSCGWRDRWVNGAVWVERN
jgi:hypothetical protein